jgi:mono/diheme cytochrome c family protein
VFDIVGISILLVLVALFMWLTRRAWRTTRPALKWLVAGASVILTVVSVTALVAALVGSYKLNRNYDNPIPNISIEVTPERVANGERFAGFCAGCHAADGSAPMEGRDFLADDGAPPIGTFYAPNLTPTHLASWTDGEILRAVREGIHRNGRSLLIMPSSAFRNLSDDDLHSIVAYLRSQPPVEPDTPPAKLNVLGAIMINVAPILEAQSPVTEPVVAPPRGPTAAYGEYLTRFACALCHGADLGGDAAFGAPGLIGAGLGWSEDQFISFIRTGVRPDGTEVDGESMPWEELSEFLASDDELRAVYAHLGTLGG